MIKYLLLVCLITTPFAQTPQAVVTHYDLEGNLIQEDSSLQGSEDIDSMNSMNMNQQDIDSNSMDSIGTDNMDHLNQETASNDSSNIEQSMNQESTVSNMNDDQNSMNEKDSMIMNTNVENSMTEQDSMYSTSDPNDISASEQNQQNVEDVQVNESTEMSNIEEVNSKVVNEIQNNNMISESNYIDPNNVEITQDNQIDILESNVEFTIDNNISNQNEVDPNTAFDVLTNTQSLQSSPEIENGFFQSEVNVDKTQNKNIPEQKTEVLDNKNTQNNNESQNNVNDKDNHKTENHDGDQQMQSSESKINKSLVQGNCIIIYSQCNFKGEALEACNSLSEIQEFNAQIRSIYIPEGLGLTVYDGENFSGNMHKFKSSQECLTTPLSFAQFNKSGNQLKGQNLRSIK